MRYIEHFYIFLWLLNTIEKLTKLNKGINISRSYHTFYLQNIKYIVTKIHPMRGKKTVKSHTYLMIIYTILSLNLNQGTRIIHNRKISQQKNFPAEKFPVRTIQHKRILHTNINSYFYVLNPFSDRTRPDNDAF